MDNMDESETAEFLAFRDQQDREYDTWLELMKVLREHGVGELNRGEKHEPIWRAIVKWGEELAELRRIDPQPEHGQNALAEKRAL
jgi:hypothetical protein